MTHCEKRRFSAAVIALLIVVMLFEAIAPSVAWAYSGVKDLQISAPSTVKVTEGKSVNINIKFKGQGIDKVSLTKSGTGLSTKFKSSTWKAYPNWCSATATVTAASGAKDGTVTVNLINNKYGIVKKAVIKIDVVAKKLSGVKDLQISAPSTVKVTEGKSTDIAINFKGVGIDKVSLTKSGTGLSTKIVKSTWKAYPNWCSATARVTAASGAKDGTVTVNLINNKHGTVKKAEIKIDVVAKAKISFSSISGPGTFTEGTEQHINGKITSTGSKIASIKGAVTNSSGKVVLSKTVKPNAYSYSLYNSALDKALTFKTLAAGKYTLKYTVKAADGTVSSKSLSFTVKSKPKTNNSAGYDVDAVLRDAYNDLGKTGPQLGYYEPWCTYYVSDLLKNNGVSVKRAGNPCDFVINVLNAGKGTYYSFRSKNVKSLVNNGLKSKKNVIETKRSNFDIRKGDIIIYLWEHDVKYYNWSHIGIVRKNHDGGKILTVEGNTTSNYVVAKRSRDFDSTVVGILRLK